MVVVLGREGAQRDLPLQELYVKDLCFPTLFASAPRAIPMSATSPDDWHTVYAPYHLTRYLSRLTFVQFRTIRVPFLSPEHADIAKRVIDVDKELQPKAVKRTLAVEGEILVACVLSLSAMFHLARLTRRAGLFPLSLSGWRV